MVGMRKLCVVLAVVGLAALVAAGASSAGTIEYRNVIGPKGTAQFSVTVFRPAAFTILLRTPTQGRTRLFLEGANAPSGGPLFDTQTSDCEGAAGSLYCQGSFETLPRGTYRFRVEYRSTTPQTARIAVDVRW